LATAGTYLHQSSFTFERYLQEYEKRWNIDPRRQPQLQEYQDRTLYTTWDISYTRLQSDDPDAAKLLKLLAYFDNQSFWYELLHGGLTNDSPDWMHKVIADDINFDGVMRTLTDYCFLEVQTALKSWSMHTCVHDWTAAALNKVIDAQHYWYAFDCVAASINEDDRDSFGQLFYARLAAHATRLVQDRFHRNNLMENIVPDRLHRASKIALLLTNQVQLTAAEQMYLWALAGKEKALGPNHTSTLITVSNLGILYCAQGKLENAELMYLRALAGNEKALGLNHTSTLMAVHNLGTLYRDQGKLEKAEQMYLRALAGNEKALVPNHTSTLMTVNNLGSLYRDQGKLEKAEQMYLRALAGIEKALGPNHTSTLMTVKNLGGLYHDQGKLEKAEQMYLRALAGIEKALGPNHKSTHETVHNLGSLYRDQGKLEKAERMYQRALAGFQRSLGSKHPFTETAMNSLKQLAL
jgi:tetratricopeptide (TPR) repeat protein